MSRRRSIGFTRLQRGPEPSATRVEKSRDVARMERRGEERDEENSGAVRSARGTALPNGAPPGPFMGSTAISWAEPAGVVAPM
jgi:hypothetical protein